MTILTALANAYAQMSDAPTFGYAMTDVGFCIVLDDFGQPAFDPIDLRQTNGKRLVGRRLALPTQLVQRTSAVRPNFLWDKTIYSLGISATSKNKSRGEHDSFKRFHRKYLSDTNDPGLLAFLRFIESWGSQKHSNINLPNEILDQNVVFALKSEYQNVYIHERDAAKIVWSQLVSDEASEDALCLVSGVSARVARSHPPIKGVDNSQTSGAFIVSNEGQAFTSYGHVGGMNAPVSETSAFAYTTALNHFLRRDSGHRVQIGDASTVFWADASDVNAAPAEKARLAKLAEAVTNGFLMGARRIDAEAESKLVGIILERISDGRPFGSVEPKLVEGVRFFVLGLSPNAARISVRFWLEDTFAHLAENYRQFGADLLMEFPALRKRPFPGIWAMTLHTAPARRDRQNKISFDKAAVSDLLAGELTRSALTNAPMPGGLLPTLISRLRTDQVLTGVRIALVKAAIIRIMRLENRLPEKDGKTQEDYLVRSDPDDPNPARRLGRLFAVIERAQRAALGSEVNATVADKFLASAAATPAQVFPGVLLNAEHHLTRLRKGHSDAEWIKSPEQARRVGAAVHRDMGRLVGLFHDGFPIEHSSEEQGLFLIGYYQERFGPASEGPKDDIEADADGDPEGE